MKRQFIRKKGCPYSWQPSEKERDEKLPGRIASVQQLKLKSAARGIFFSQKVHAAFAWLAIYVHNKNCKRCRTNRGDLVFAD